MIMLRSRPLTRPSFRYFSTTSNPRVIPNPTAMSNNPKIISSIDLSPRDAKWITLKKLTWIDGEGRERLWECAQRKTRKSAGIDAVAIFAVIRSKTNSFPPSTVVIEQYRPPIDKVIIELPAGPFSSPWFRCSP
ncbi:hypothetical protein E1B28_008540 [Marasmius oreades]|uniref:Uncharacterized protein n=1 Tax=Marasmius oreades TaxID=181124 RepID=A0A9P7RYL8_9AGAR|nr:uncharacterized protein E1B28_008540 [Marasmius oreades]KAG7092171.1 hypothetical protein E1B28_008540 [Marasmius oreades]